MFRTVAVLGEQHAAVRGGVAERDQRIARDAGGGERPLLKHAAYEIARHEVQGQTGSVAQSAPALLARRDQPWRSATWDTRDTKRSSSTSRMGSARSHSIGRSG